MNGGKAKRILQKTSKEQWESFRICRKFQGNLKQRMLLQGIVRVIVLITVVLNTVEK